MNFAIEVQNLTKKFGDFTAVDNISFNVQANHIVGFLGPNGAGKTTTLRTIVGLSKATSGAITIAENEVKFGQISTNTSIGYLPEQPSFYNWMSGYEYLDFIANIFKLDKTIKEKRIKDLLELTDLTEVRNRKISGYSNGMKQRLGIAQALINDPKVLILDEPVSALDPIGRKDVMQIIEALKHSKTILISTHILADVDRICDDIVLIQKGEIIANAPLAELKEQHALPVLEIEFLSNPKEILNELSSYKWANKTELNGNTIRIWISDKKVVEENIILPILSKYKIGILNYGLKLPTTEDLFIQLIEKQKNG